MLKTGKNIYASVTRSDGSFLVRGMASEEKAREIFLDFREAQEGGKSAFSLLSSHDARLSVRSAAMGLFEAEVIARNARKSALFGLLPAASEIALRGETFRAEEIEQIIHALYVLGRGPFRNLVEQELNQ